MFYDDHIHKLENIWKKLLNVVLIRERKRKYKNGTSIRKFELFTVPYPFSMKYVNKKINDWTNGKLRYRKEMFTDKANNLQGIELKAAVYGHIPMVINNTNSTDLSGVEIETVKALSKIMNFTVNFYRSNDWQTERWGKLLSNGTYTGLIGEIVNNRADFALGDIHHSEFYLDLIDFSIPHSIECLTFLTPESIADNSWKTLIIPFSGGMWAGVLLSLFCVGAIFFAISRVHWLIKKQYKNNFQHKYYKFGKNTFKRTCFVSRKTDVFDKFSNCILFTYSMLLLVTLPKMPKSWPLRILTGFYWIYCILIGVTYRASFTSILANPAPRITIDSVEELANSGLVVGVWGSHNVKFFQKSFDEYTQILGSKLEIVDDEFSSIDKIIEGRFAYFDNEYFLRHLRLQEDSNGIEEVLHIMKECVVHMPISLGLEKNSPLKPNIDKYLRRLIEGGFIQKWLNDATKNLKAEEEQPQEALINLKKFWSSFVALVIGYFLGVCALIFEKLHFEYVVKKHPIYDKYNVRAYYDYIRNKNNVI